MGLASSQAAGRLRLLARRAGVGRALLRVAQLRSFSVSGAIAVALAKRTYLRQIAGARPIACGPLHDAVELHMLLHHAKLYEGVWGLYSFAYFSGVACHVIVHDDGSLTEVDRGILRRVLPGCDIIIRDVADAAALSYLESHGLTRCADIRRSKYVHILKLFDPLLLARRESFIVMDSDVLFFAYPAKLLESDLAYSEDVGYDYGYGYSLSLEELSAMLGKACIERLNCGLVKVRRDAVSFECIERHLEALGAANYYIEQTLWALEYTLNGASPLPSAYAICPRLDDKPAISGHYCGGGYFAGLYYTRALPRLAREFLS
jgi:hypothetical protein